MTMDSPIDATTLGLLRQIFDNSKTTATLAEEFKSMGRDMSALRKSVEAIDDRHNSIRTSCAEHCARTEIALKTAETAEKKIDGHIGAHWKWVATIFSAIPILGGIGAWAFERLRQK